MGLAANSEGKFRAGFVLSGMNILRSSIAVLQKEWREERASLFTLNSVLTFTGSSLLLAIFAMKAQSLDPTPKSGLLWIILLYAGLSAGLGGFLREQDRRTLDLLRIHADPIAVYLGKLIYNILFLMVLIGLFLGLYNLLMGRTATDPALFAIIAAAGSIGMSGVTTLISALITRTDAGGALFSVLSIPLLVPLVLILTRLSRHLMTGGQAGAMLSEVMALVGFCGVTITMGLLLFPQVFEEED
jgi:heme exporter protein B